jgi:hypothetical protein
VLNLVAVHGVGQIHLDRDAKPGAASQVPWVIGTPSAPKRGSLVDAEEAGSKGVTDQIVLGLQASRARGAKVAIRAP